MNGVVHRLFAFSAPSLSAQGSAHPFAWAARPAAGSEPDVVRVQMLRATSVTLLALSSSATLFKAGSGVCGASGSKPLSLSSITFAQPGVQADGLKAAA